MGKFDDDEEPELAVAELSLVYFKLVCIFEVKVIFISAMNWIYSGFLE